MFGIGMPELLVIFVIALLVVGPKKLPDLAKIVGKGLAEFRKATEGATETLKETLRVDEIKQDVEEMKESFLSEKSHADAGSDTPPAPPESPPRVAGEKMAASHPPDAAAQSSPIP